MKTTRYPISYVLIVLSFILFSSLWTCSTKKVTETQKVGAIFVNSVPAGAEIYLDGDSTGNQTPDTLFDIKVGNHLVWVSMEGHLSSPPDSLIYVDEDKMDTVEFVLLETSYGSLKVSSNVDSATICIDKKPTTELTPHVFFNSVPVGTHIISIFKGGHANEKPAKQVVSIATGDTVEVDFTLSSAEVGKVPGNIIPDFELEDDYGFLHRFYAYRGFVTMINFWAEDCDYCLEELDSLEEIYTEYLADSLIIFGINYRDGLDQISQRRAQDELTFTLLHGVGSDIVTWVHVPPSPVTIFLDRDGKIYYYHLGFKYYSAPGIFRQKLDELFDK